MAILRLLSLFSLCIRRGDWGGRWLYEGYSSDGGGVVAFPPLSPPLFFFFFLL